MADLEFNTRIAAFNNDLVHLHGGLPASMLQLKSIHAYEYKDVHTVIPLLKAALDTEAFNVLVLGFRALHQPKQNPFSPNTLLKANSVLAHENVKGDFFVFSMETYRDIFYGEDRTHWPKLMFDDSHKSDQNSECIVGMVAGIKFYALNNDKFEDRGLGLLFGEYSFSVNRSTGAFYIDASKVVKFSTRS